MVQVLRTGILSAALALLVTSGLQAAEDQVSVKGVHLCCGACVNDVAKALKGVEGVSKVSSDRNSKVVTFTATDEKAAKAGVEALAKHGFGGEATYGEQKVAFPDNGAKKDTKSDKVAFSGVHLCCGGCVKGVQEALKDVKNVDKIEVDRTGKTVVLIGSDVDVSEAAKALNDGGYYGKVKAE